MPQSTTTSAAPVSAAAPHILVSNDDGIEAPGIIALVQALADADFVVHVVAPRSEQSAKSQALSLATPHVVEQLRDAHPQAASSFAVYGTPADAVMVALASPLLQVGKHCRCRRQKLGGVPPCRAVPRGT